MRTPIERLIEKIVERTIRRKHPMVPVRKLREATQRAGVVVLHNVHDVLVITLGIAMAGFGLKGFLIPNGFIDGGVTGISLLMNEVSGISVSIWLVVINLPFLILGYFNIGREFAVKSMLSIIALALAVHFIDYPIITNDKLLVAIFGGFLLGSGIGLAVRGGAVLDGTEVLAIFISRKTGMTIGDVIFGFNVIIFGFGAYILSIEIALYAILTYLAASKTVDFVIEGVEEYTGVTIISKDHNEAIRLMIIEKMGRGVTIYVGKSGYGKNGENLEPTNVIYTVITRLEVARLQTEIDKIDPEAFVVMNSLKDTKGGMVKKRRMAAH